MVTGLGSMLADCIFAAAGLLTLSLVSSFVEANTVWICLAGGVILMGIGVSVILAKGQAERKDGSDLQEKASGSKNGVRVSYAVQTLVSALSNPAALAMMFALLALFKVSADSVPVWISLPCVAAGEMLWWFFVTSVAIRVGRSLSARSASRARLLLGAGVCCFGLIVAIKGLIMLF